MGVLVSLIVACDLIRGWVRLGLFRLPFFGVSLWSRWVG